MPDEVVRAALSHLSEAEFREAVAGAERLRALGLVDEEGRVDYGLALELIALAKRDEYLKRAILSFVAREFGDDLRRMLGLSMAHVKLEWTDDFESFLVERKRRRRVSNPKTLKYYRRLFMEHLEGRALDEGLAERVARHPNPWLRNVFRHYVQYLFYRRRISPEAYGWLMEVVPSRNYRLDVRPYPASLEEVGRALEQLRAEHELYYTVYRLMLESGCRLHHALRLLESWSPSEVVEVPGVELVTPRLVVFEERGFARYYLGLRGPEKPCDWVYMSLDTLRLLKRHAPRRLDGAPITRYAARRGLPPPKVMRKVAWRLMVRAVGREVARLLQSRWGELKVSEARYEDLVSEADEVYPRYLELLRELLPSDHLNAR